MATQKTNRKPKYKYDRISLYKVSIYLLIVVSSIFILLVLAGGTEGETITVNDDGGADHTTIQEAIDAAVNGDTIRVFEGTYEENVVVDKKVHVIGNGSESTEIDGHSEIGIVIEMKNDDITVENLTFRNGEIGLFVHDVKGITIKSCAISNNEVTGYLLCDSITMTNISLTENNASGLQIFGNYNDLQNFNVELNEMSSRGNFYKSFADAVYTTDFSTDNDDDDETWSVWYDESDDEYINEVERDSRSLSELQDVYQITLPQILLVQKKWALLSGDYENDCPVFDYNPGGSVKELDFLNDVDLDDYVDGFDSASLQNLYTTNSTFLANKWLYFTDDPDVIPYFLEIEDLPHAIYIEGNLNTIGNCDVTDNNASGIFIHGDNNTLTNNIISRNKIGVILERSHNNIAHNNDIFNNAEYGINASSNDDIAINATDNFWGSDTGPYHPTENPDGEGDNITDHIVFDPWTGKAEVNSTRFYGNVREKDTNIIIVNAKVTISDNDTIEYTTYTDENGYYGQDVVPGNYTITAEKEDYSWYMEIL